MWGFYGRWLKTALWHGLGPADLWSGLVGALLGVADHYWPHLQLLPLYGWQIPIWAFATFFVGRLVMAPYWMWLEDQKVSPAKVDLAKRKRLSQLRSDGVARRHAAISTIDEADADWFAILDAVPQSRVPVWPFKGGQHLKAFGEHDYRLLRLDQLIQKFGSRI
jgi:hypothetical protein